MTRSLVLIQFILAMIAGVAVAEEPSRACQSEQADSGSLEFMAQSPPACMNHEEDGSSLFKPAAVEFKGLKLSDEDLGLVRGGAVAEASPDFQNPRGSDIILWDEARTQGGEMKPQRNNGRSLTIISLRGR